MEELVKGLVIARGGKVVGRALTFAEGTRLWFHAPKAGEWKGYEVSQPPKGGGLNYCATLTEQQFTVKFLAEQGLKAAAVIEAETKAQMPQVELKAAADTKPAPKTEAGVQAAAAEVRKARKS